MTEPIKVIRDAFARIRSERDDLYAKVAAAERREQEARAQERKACADLAHRYAYHRDYTIEAAIRARGKQ